jgi:hypothetical protein
VRRCDITVDDVEPASYDLVHSRFLLTQTRRIRLGSNDHRLSVRQGPARRWIKTWQRIDDAVIANGILTDHDVAEMRRAYEDPNFTYRAQLTQAVWGRRPTQG